MTIGVAMKCPFCGRPVTGVPEWRPDRKPGEHFDCLYCGRAGLVGSAGEVVEEKVNIPHGTYWRRAGR